MRIRAKALGLPINIEYLARLTAHWERLQLHFIVRETSSRCTTARHFANSVGR